MKLFPSSLALFFLLGCDSAPKTLDHTYAQPAPGKEPLYVAAPDPTTPVSPLSPLVVVYSQSVKTTATVQVTLTTTKTPAAAYFDFNRPPTTYDTTSSWSADNKTLTITAKQAFPLASELHLKVIGARSEAGDAFKDVDGVVITKRNPSTRDVAYGSPARTTFYTRNEQGQLVSAMDAAGDLMTPDPATATDCKHYRNTGTMSETFDYVAAGNDHLFCTADDQMVTSYEYIDDGDDAYRFGTSSSVGPDGRGHTADDAGPAYQITTRVGDQVKVCTSTDVGSDGVFLTDDDAYNCSCIVDDPAQISGVRQRHWVNQSDCSIATATGYLDEGLPQKSADGSFIVLKIYTPTTAGTANPASDAFVSGITYRYNMYGQRVATEAFTESEDAPINGIRVTYDDLGNKVESLDTSAGVDMHLDTSDDVLLSRTNFDTTH